MRRNDSPPAAAYLTAGAGTGQHVRQSNLFSVYETGISLVRGVRMQIGSQATLAGGFRLQCDALVVRGHVSARCSPARFTELLASSPAACPRKDSGACSMRRWSRSRRAVPSAAPRARRSQPPRIAAGAVAAGPSAAVSDLERLKRPRVSWAIGRACGGGTQCAASAMLVEASEGAPSVPGYGHTLHNGRTRGLRGFRSRAKPVSRAARGRGARVEAMPAISASDGTQCLRAIAATRSRVFAARRQGDALRAPPPVWSPPDRNRTPDRLRARGRRRAAAPTTVRRRPIRADA